MTLRHALAVSQNVPAVRLIEMLGPYSVAQFAHRLGIDSALDPNLSLALGTSEVTLLDLTSAFAVFPNFGEKIKPYGVMEVLDRQGRVIWRTKPQKRLVMSRTTAAIVTNILEGVIQEGTWSLRRPKRQFGLRNVLKKFKDELFQNRQNLEHLTQKDTVSTKSSPQNLPAEKR